ncbi:MAG: penicillin-binding protein 1C [Fusobacterium sp.]
MKIVFKIILFFTIIVFIITCGIYVRFDAENTEKIFEDRYSVSVLDNNGKIMGVYLNKNEQWHLKSIDKIPEKLKTAVMFFEDKNFYSHNGVDFFAVIRALKDNIFEGRRTGASTITMQAVKMAQPKERSYFNKYLEIVHAFKLEKYYKKDEILKMYLNNAPYGGNIVGYKTASYMYFRKSPKELTWSEAALLAVLPNSPGLMNVEKNREKLIEKRNFLLKKLYEKNFINERQYRISLKEPVPDKRYSFPALAPHLVRRLVNENKDKKIIKSTIDSEIQKKTEKAVKDYSEFLKLSGINNTAVLIINNKNYEVTAYAGSQDFYDFKNNGQVDGITAKRSPGSLLKPFLYAKVIDEGIAAPQSKILDVPLYFSNFSPQNANKKYYGMVEMRDALIKSLNIPFVELLKDYGEDKFFYFLKDILNFEDRNPERYGLSLILGTKEFTMEEIGILYSGLANYGNFKNLKYTKESTEEGRQLLTKGVSYLTLTTMRELERPGMEKFYREKNPVSWKTGTSHGRRDGWAAGITPEWTVVVWTGNFTGEGNPNLTGVYTGGNLLFNILKILPKTEKDFVMPSDLKKIKVDKETGYRLKYDVPYKEIFYPKDAKPLKVSPYYKKIFVNKNGEEIDSRDESFNEREEKYILVYPLEVVNYFVRENLDVSNIFSEKTAKKTIKFIYPKNNLKIIVPKDFDGEKSLIVKIANIKNQELYWYVNKEYAGKSREKERSFNFKKGKYEITVVSESGETAKINFQVAEK